MLFGVERLAAGAFGEARVPRWSIDRASLSL